MKRPYLTHPIHLKYETGRRLEKLLIWFVWRLPKKVVYWGAIRLMANATQGEYSDQVVPDLTAMDALDRWSTHDPA